MHKHNATTEEKEMLGLEYCYECEVKNIADYTERCRLNGLEMDKFFESLPDWVDDGDKFSLWMMTEEERKLWLIAHAPEETLAYFQVTLNPSKPIQVGNIRI